MKKIILILFVIPFFLKSQSSYNMQLLGEYSWAFTEGNDIWGWVDLETDNEYALIGLKSGVSCVNVSDPNNLYEEFNIPDVNSTWRDIKTWGNYAYVTTDDDGPSPLGLLIIDLSDMSGNTHWHVTEFYNFGSTDFITFNAAHNLYIDENGICYIFGASSNTNNTNTTDGAIFLNVGINPVNPIFLGKWSDEYIHDGMVRGDTMYAGCINTGDLYIIDVSNKSNPIVMGSHPTPNAFTHNAWISDDGNYVFTTDEKPDSYIGVYDITDLSNIQEVDRIQSNPGSNSIPHNTHVDGNFLVTSWYRDGTVVHDISNPQNLVQVAYFDSYNGGGNLGPNDGFDGCWGTYPFLPSGIIISSDINSSQNGSARLLLYERGFSGACHLEGTVTDGLTGSNISGASIEILNTAIPNITYTTLNGDYFSGNADAGNYNIVFSMPGYITDTLQVSLLNGEIVVLNAILFSDPNVSILGCMNPLAENFNPNANTSLEFGGEISINFSNGSYFDGNQHLVFNASTNFLIKSAYFYAEDNNQITFELRDNLGYVIDDTTYNLVVGEQQLILNFEVPIGNDMQLGISNDNSGLFRNNSEAQYPYNIGSIMSITGNSANEPGYYYFYYNIEVEVPCNNISTKSWDCNDEGLCFNTDIGEGQYETLYDCELVCNTVSTDIIKNKQNKTVIKVFDVLGKDSDIYSKKLLYFLYEDGSVEKRIF